MSAPIEESIQADLPSAINVNLAIATSDVEVIVTEALPASLFRTFPAEIREKILTLLLQGDWVGQVPAIIKALRPDQELYREAIAIFCKSATLTISEDCIDNVSRMGSYALASVRKVHIEITYASRSPSISCIELT